MGPISKNSPRTNRDGVEVGIFSPELVGLFYTVGRMYPSLFVEPNMGFGACLVSGIGLELNYFSLNSQSGVWCCFRNGIIKPNSEISPMIMGYNNTTTPHVFISPRTISTWAHVIYCISLFYINPPSTVSLSLSTRQPLSSSFSFIKFDWSSLLFQFYYFYYFYFVHQWHLQIPFFLELNSKINEA